jgi:hypothetical protein
MASYSGISGASGVANHVHRRSDEHGRWWDQHGLVISSSHRLPSGDVALFKRSMIHVYERQCSIS